MSASPGMMPRPTVSHGVSHSRDSLTSAPSSRPPDSAPGAPHRIARGMMVSSRISTA